MSAVHRPNQGIIPGSFTVLTGRVTDGNDHKSGFVGVVTFNQGKCTLCEQTLARLILHLTISVGPARGETKPTNWEKSSCTLPSWSSRQSFPSLECPSIPNKRNLSPARPSSCFVDLNYRDQSG